MNVPDPDKAAEGCLGCLVILFVLGVIAILFSGSYYIFKAAQTL